MQLMWILFKASLKSQAQYKFDFIINLIGNVLGIIGDFIIIYFILMRFHQIDGWNIYEIALIYFIVEFGFGMYRLIGDGFNKFEELILSGRFDALLIRPVSTLFQVMLQRIDFKRLGMVLQACAVGIWGMTHTPLREGFYLYLPILLGISTVVNLEISIMLAAIAFWSGKNKDIIILGHYSTRSAANYPATIYNAFFSKLLTFIIPFFSVSYYPLVFFTRKSDAVYLLFAPVMAVIVLTPITLFIWKLGIKKYSSTGT